eukprot:Skav201360  [mRNA]  locus=scaffold2471:107673:110281:+ [translate_table: standard]
MKNFIDIKGRLEPMPGQPTFVVLRFFANLPKNDGLARLQEVRDQWREFVIELNGKAPTAAGEVLMVSYAWTKTEMASCNAIPSSLHYHRQLSRVYCLSHHDDHHLLRVTDPLSKLCQSFVHRLLKYTGQDDRAGSKDKLQMTLVNLGPSILGGAFTTAAATVFLLPCRIVLFVKLGTMLVAWLILACLCIGLGHETLAVIQLASSSVA